MLGIISMHFIGALYSFIQFLYFNQSDILIYNISRFSLGKFAFHLLMLTPLTLLGKLINYKNNQKI